MTWRQEGNRVYFDSGQSVRFMEMPPAFCLDDVHPALLWLAERTLRNQLWEPPRDLPPRRKPGETVGVLYSGGRDSTAVMHLLTGERECVPFHYRWTNAEGFHSRAEAVVRSRTDAVVTVSDFHELGCEGQSVRGMYNWLVYGVGAILLADHYRLGTLVGGYLYDGHVHTMHVGFRFPGLPFKDGYGVFLRHLHTAGLEMPHLAGCLSEYVSESLMASCEVPTASCGCRFAETGEEACWKCCRKLPYRGVSVPFNEKTDRFIAEQGDDSILYYALTTREFGIDHPGMRAFDGIDVDWQRDYLAFGLDKVMSGEWADFLRRRMQDFGVEPMEDASRMARSVSEFHRRSNYA